MIGGVMPQTNDQLDAFILENNKKHTEYDTYHYCLKLIILELARKKNLNAELDSKDLHQKATVKVFNILGSQSANIFTRLVHEGMLTRKKCEHFKNLYYYRLNTKWQSEIKSSLWDRLKQQVTANNYGDFDFTLVKDNSENKPLKKERQMSRDEFHLSSDNSGEDILNNGLSDVDIEEKNNDDHKFSYTQSGRKIIKRKAEVVDRAEDTKFRKKGNNIDLLLKEYEIINKCYQSQNYKAIREKIKNNDKIAKEYYGALSFGAEVVLDFIVAYTLYYQPAEGISLAAIKQYINSYIDDVEAAIEIDVEACLQELKQGYDIFCQAEKVFLTPHLQELCTTSVAQPKTPGKSLFFVSGDKVEVDQLLSQEQTGINSPKNFP